MDEGRRQKAEGKKRKGTKIKKNYEYLTKKTIEG